VIADTVTWIQLAVLAAVAVFLFFKRMRPVAWGLLAAVQASYLYFNGATLLGVFIVLCLLLQAGMELVKR
jgi:hypothetical protein